MDFSWTLEDLWNHFTKKRRRSSNSVVITTVTTKTRHTTETQERFFLERTLLFLGIAQTSKE